MQINLHYIHLKRIHKYILEVWPIMHGRSFFFALPFSSNQWQNRKQTLSHRFPKRSPDGWTYRWQHGVLPLSLVIPLTNGVHLPQSRVHHIPNRLSPREQYSDLICSREEWFDCKWINFATCHDRIVGNVDAVPVAHNE